MCSAQVSILKYIFKPKRGGPPNIWEPEEGDEDEGAEGSENGSMASTLAAEILPPVIALIP